MKRLKVTNLAPMPTLFDFSEDTITTAPMEAATPAPRVIPILQPAPAPAPEPDPCAEIQARLDALAAAKDIHGIIALTRYRRIRIERYEIFNTSAANPSLLVRDETGPRDYAFRERQRHESVEMQRHLHTVDRVRRDYEHFTLTLGLAFVGRDCRLRTTVVTCAVEALGNRDIYACQEITVKPFKEQKRYDPEAVFLQTDTELMTIIRAEKPYIAAWLDERDYRPTGWLRAPWAETLSKAGYAFATPFLAEDRYLAGRPTDQDRINRLVQHGTKPANIFKTEKCVYTALKSEWSLERWDLFRRLIKRGKVTKDSLDQVLEMMSRERNPLRERDLVNLNSVLGAKHHDKEVFSWTGLVNYLNRIDRFEAIDAPQGLQLLKDYLGMCRELDMEPRTDGDSLKREHDIAARLVRERYDEIQQKKMQEYEARVQREIAEGRSKMHLVTYSEEVYSCRPILGYDDLLDEARQQHNCVASYAKAIRDGKSVVVTLRETRHPEKSLVTIELSPDLKTIRQKLLAYNQEIRNKSITDFIERWHRRILNGAPQETAVMERPAEETAAAA